ncbi:hypothetical protein PIB30_091559 [Stylosanthes scabra]|uniref:Uncharacterized protein n=1 Tax=Stylosanthes scabra TaxID=79078 RepID=A0ABU6TV45_9FABA|nr:hypothetical protein [Stylosanthes scabra]
MPRAKQTTKRTRNEEVVHMEPPSDHPLFQYFSRLDDLNNYIFNFSERIVISPSGESGRGISQNSIIDERTIHHMGRGIEEGEEQQPPPPPQEQAPQEQAGLPSNLQ